MRKCVPACLHKSSYACSPRGKHFCFHSERTADPLYGFLLSAAPDKTSSTKPCSGVGQAPGLLPAALPTAGGGRFLPAGLPGPQPPAPRAPAWRGRPPAGPARCAPSPVLTAPERSCVCRMGWALTPVPGCLPNIGCLEAGEGGRGVFVFI